MVVSILSTGNTFQESIRNVVWDSFVQMFCHQNKSTKSLSMESMEGKALSQHFFAVLD